MKDASTGAPLAHMAAVALAAALPALPRLASTDFCLDDAYIHLSYVKSLHLGDGLSYNPGDFETGASSPLWVWALAGLGSPTPPAWAVKLLGLCCHMATAVLAMTFAARLTTGPARRGASLYAGILVGTTPWLVQGAVSGMEVSLTALLWLAVAAAAGKIADGDDRGAPWIALVLSTLAYLARPESLAFCGLLGLLTFRRRRTVAALAPGIGALIGATLWSTYLLAVSGYPLPNTFYVKAGGLHWESLGYLGTGLLPWQPALTSLALPLALWLWRRGSRDTKDGDDWGSVLELGVLCLGTLVAVALTRKLATGTLFFHSRHLAPIMWAPPTMTAVAIARLHRRAWGRRWMRPLGAALALATGATLYLNNGLMAEQESGVRRLHTDVARYVTNALPQEAVLAVEGAGALRYFTPRPMRIVDLIGLNTGPIAHGPRSAAARLCYAATRGTTHVAYLGHWHAALNAFLEMRRLRVFEARRYAQTLPRQAYAVVVAEIKGHREAFHLPCAQLARDRGWLQKPSAP